MRVAVAGGAGRMSRMLTGAVNNAGDMVLAGVLSRRPSRPGLSTDIGEVRDSGGYVESDVDDILKDADVLIDFTRPEAVSAHLAAAARHRVALVIGTTGLSDAQVEEIRRTAAVTPIVFAPCMSESVTHLLSLLERAASMFGEGYDIEIVEAHHRNKTDAPSGTALAMGEAIAAAQGRSLAECAIYGRQGETGPRARGAIGFAAVRGGDIVGEHTVMFLGHGHRIEITHRAMSRQAYVDGALEAARFLRGGQHGLFDMKDVVGIH
ncbi:4-hydroxy-tetrahydrodipicolinate reductase [Paraburkholderia sp.]|uniref:4-hydroxy-tetrahydrodipicolinate reductase n=1 Tax=Paraburkholderia sp. TaxID=1926495 RepID=UPI0039E4CF54